MGEHETWFHLIPGVRDAEVALRNQLGTKSYFFGNDLTPTPGSGSLSFVIMAAFAVGLVTFVAMRYRSRLVAAGDGGVVPERSFNARSFVEVLCEGALNMMSGVMGEKAARHFLPLIGTLAFFILFANLLGLVPGFLPATDSSNTNIGMALIVFFATHIYGFKENGMGYLKHFMGPILVLAPLMFVIEVVGHLARPISLTLRLAGNMIGDHKVLSLFLGLVPVLVPIPFLVLGMIVCTVQALVFCLLSVVYIGLAIEHHDDDH